MEDIAQLKLAYNQILEENAILRKQLENAQQQKEKPQNNIQIDTPRPVVASKYMHNLFLKSKKKAQKLKEFTERTS